MSLTGHSLIGNSSARQSGEPFCPKDPRTGETLSPPYYPASPDAVDAAADLARKAFGSYRNVDPARRAAFLNAIATEIESLGEALTSRYMAESGLPEERAIGERGRTCLQLQQFAELIESPGWNQDEDEPAEPDRLPLPRPSTRRQYIAIGPVAVFGPANFPLAYDVAGGDTAAALAAGCPVIVKAHPGHPGTCELVGQAIIEAARDTGMPEGVFSLIFDDGNDAGQHLVRHPGIKAVAFTGSETGGRALFDLAARRPEPIPVFAEMSSVNPVLLFPDRLSHASEVLAESFVGSLTLGVGQFCTNPGLIVLPDNEDGASFIEAALERLGKSQPQAMLNTGIRAGYEEGLQRLGAAEGVEPLLIPENDRGPGGCHATPALFSTGARSFTDQPDLHQEVFGPVSLIVLCRNSKDMEAVMDCLKGHLTTSFHATGKDLEGFADLIASLETKAGRIICNGWPTGVEVCRTMVHGGPYPATTDSRFTAVGIRSIDRFLRPVCYQNFDPTTGQFVFGKD